MSCSRRAGYTVSCMKRSFEGDPLLPLRSTLWSPKYDMKIIASLSSNTIERIFNLLHQI